MTDGNSEPELAKVTREPFIIEFISVVDIPCLENKTKCDPYIQAVMGCPNEGQLTLFQYQKIGRTVRTQTRFDCSSVVYHCYRDLNVTPPSRECVLMLELFHQSKDPHKPDLLIGKVDIPLKAFTDDDPITFPFINFKSGFQGKNPDFAVTIRRAFTDPAKPPPLYRTFFIIRHGQSKWNRAMSRISIAGMLDRDHALTTEGIEQALSLNARWRQELLQDTNYNTMHTADSTLMVPEMFDFSRMDENETLELEGDNSDDDGSDSDGDNTAAAVASGAANNGTSPVPIPGSGKGTGFAKLYDSFFLKRPSTITSQPGDAVVSPNKADDGTVMDFSDMDDVQQLSNSTHSNLSDLVRSRRNTVTSNNSYATSSSAVGFEQHTPFSPSSAQASTATLPNTPIATRSRRNTYIYSSDYPTPPESPSIERKMTGGCIGEVGEGEVAFKPTDALPGLNGNIQNVLQPLREGFTSFDEAFPPPEPMENPFEAPAGRERSLSFLPMPVDANHRPNALEVVQAILTATSASAPASTSPLAASVPVLVTPTLPFAEEVLSPEPAFVSLILPVPLDTEVLFPHSTFVAALPPIAEGVCGAEEEAVVNETTLETTSSPLVQTENPFDHFPAQEPDLSTENPFDVFVPLPLPLPPFPSIEGLAEDGTLETLPHSTPAPTLTAGETTIAAAVDPFTELCSSIDMLQNFATTSVLPNAVRESLSGSPMGTNLPVTVNPFENLPTSPGGDLLGVDLPPLDPSACQNVNNGEIDFMNRSINLLSGVGWPGAAAEGEGEKEEEEMEVEQEGGTASGRGVGVGLELDCSSTKSQQDEEEQENSTNDANSQQGSKQEDDDLVQRREEYIRLFMRADIVYSSPLTRALQTALAAMCGHPALTKNKLVLYRTIREIKRIGGLDTVGIECGAAIMKRVKNELQSSVGASKAEELTESVEVDYTSAENPWWTTLASFDNEKDQLQRIRDFITVSRYCSHTVPVFVGHSLFFRAFYSKRLSKVMARKRPNLTANLKQHKLGNATLMAVTVKYLDHDSGASEALILDADILFGGGFHGAKHVNTQHPHHDSADSGANEGIPSSLGLSEADIDGSLQLEKEQDNIHKLASSIQHSKDAISKGVSIISSSISELF